MEIKANFLGSYKMVLANSSFSYVFKELVRVNLTLDFQIEAFYEAIVDTLVVVYRLQGMNLSAVVLFLGPFLIA